MSHKNSHAEREVGFSVLTTVDEYAAKTFLPLQIKHDTGIHQLTEGIRRGNR